MPSFSPENTWLIFGCSPFIKKIKDKIPALLQKYPNNIGLNTFHFYFYPGVQYVCTNDFLPNRRDEKLIINFQKNNNAVTENIKSVHYIFMPNVQNPVLVDKFKWIDTDKFECGELYGVHTVALPAINYALLQGAKNVVLIGVDLSLNWQHFYDKPRPASFNVNNYRKIRQVKMLNCLSELNKYVNIYNVNPKAETNVPIISIEEL